MGGEIEEMTGEYLVGEEAEGNLDEGGTGQDQEAEVDKGNQEAGVGEGEQEAGVDGEGDQDAGEEAEHERPIIIIEKSVRFAPDLPTGSGGRG